MVHKRKERGFIRAPRNDENSDQGCIRGSTLKKKAESRSKAQMFKGIHIASPPKARSNIGHPLTEERVKVECGTMKMGERTMHVKMRSEIRLPAGTEGVENIGVKESKKVL